MTGAGSVDPGFDITNAVAEDIGAERRALVSQKTENSGSRDASPNTWLAKPCLAQ